MQKLESNIFFGNLFLHYFDLHFLDLMGISNEGPNVKRRIKYECNLATRIAVLSAETVYIPASSFFESSTCYDIISKFEQLYDFGRIYLVGGGLSLHEFVHEKIVQYSSSPLHVDKYKIYKNRLPVHPPFFSRKRSATKDIAYAWNSSLSNGSSIDLLEPTVSKLPADFEKRWNSVNDRLSGQAFIVDNVMPLLFEHYTSRFTRNRLHSVINEPYFGSFTKELAAGVVSNMNYLVSPHHVPSFGRDLPYKQIVAEVFRSGLLSRIIDADVSELSRIRESPEWKVALATAIERSAQQRFAERLIMNSDMMRIVNEVSVGIVTALPHEYAAVCEVLSAKVEIDFPGSTSGLSYAWAQVKAQGGGSHVVAVSQLTDMGNNSASIRATQMLGRFPNIKLIVMAGIAGAVPNPSVVADHVRLGDIVVSNEMGVIQYDFEKVTPSENKNRSRPRPPAAVLLDAVNRLVAGELRGSRPWDEYIFKVIDRLGFAWERPNESLDILKDRRRVSHPSDAQRVAGKPRLFRGPIASANKLLKNYVVRDSLRDTFAVKAVEMEGSGIADSTWGHDIGYIVVRGTCDYCNTNKNDLWQKYAAVVAAAFTRSLLEATPILSVHE